MKIKIIAVSLSLMLVFTACIGVSAQTYNDLSETPIIQTENSNYNESRSINTSFINNNVYRIRNSLWR